VNLGHFVYDTTDLSTVRGGGLLLLDSTDWVFQKLQGDGVKLSPVILGASAGLFKIEESPKPLNVLRDDVDSALRGHAQYQHATFVVDVIDGDEANFPQDRAKLVNLNRLRQMQAPSLIYPKVWNVVPSAKVCELDLMRPTPPGKVNSESSEARREYGRERKQNLYADILMKDAGIAKADIQKVVYANELSDIAGKSGGYGNLQDKMAVLYLDGNKFGALQKGKPIEEQRRFSFGLRKHQAEFLWALLDQRVWGERSWMNAEKVRLETLLWGGDEVIWVAPAWKGWELLKFFFEHLGGWDSYFGERLTFSASLVFCHQKSPIHSIQQLSKRLCEAAKKVEAKRNQFAYQILESFDNVDDATHVPQVFEATHMAEFTAALPEIRNAVPRRQLHIILRSIDRGVSFPKPEDKPDYKPTADQIALEESEKKALKDLSRLHPGIADSVRGKVEQWKHIGELWDYAGIEEGR